MRVRSILLPLAVALALVATASPALGMANQTPTSAPPTIAPRIVGGTAVPAGELGYVALVLVDAGNGEVDQCGGTVIDPSWILTAAHCTIDLMTGAARPASAFEVRTGSRFASSGGIVHTVDAVRRQPMDPALLDKDVALLHLVHPAQAAPVTLIGSTPDEQTLDDPGVTATTAGWGLTSETGTTPVEQLRKVSISVKPDPVCTSAYPDDDSSELFPTFYVPANMVCAGGPGKDSCAGDSGGPLLAPGPGGSGTRQIGIVSWGLGCARPGFPGVYTRLATFAPWVRTNTAYGPFVDATGFVNGSYRDFTNALPTAAERSTWLANLSTQPPESLLSSLAAGSTWDLQGGVVIRLYRAWFQAYPSTSSMAAWLQRRRAGLYLAPMSAQFAANPSRKARYDHLTNAQFVDQVYLDVLGHAGSPTNAATWKQRLDHGLARSDLMVTFAQSAEFRARIADRTRVYGSWFAMVKRMPTLAELVDDLGVTQTEVLARLRASVAYAQQH